MREEKKNVIVIGGGVIGAASAYYLCKRGWKVTVIEKEQWGQGSSHGNCGLILPSHVLPLNMPGVIWQGLRWMVKKDAPLYIKPRGDLSLLMWLLRFARRCNRRSMLRTASARSAMLQGALGLYRALIQDEEIDCDWMAQGVLCVFRSRGEFEKYRRLDAVINAFGEESRILDRQALLELEPTLREDVAGAYLYPGSAHLRPDFLMREFKRVLTSLGVTLLEQTTVSAFQKASGRVQAAVTNRGPVAADEFVVATGAWTPYFERQLGCRIPIQPGKGYSVTLSRPQDCPSRPCLLEEDRVVATPWNSGFRLGGTMEFSGYDASLNRMRLAALFRGVQRYFKKNEFGPVQEEWSGWRPMTYDGLPIIDRPPHLENVLLAAGHNMVGLSLAPSTGKLVCELLSGDHPHVDPKPYRLGRLAKHI
jgi:D-amino-acid dehydrogenase